MEKGNNNGTENIQDNIEKLISTVTRPGIEPGTSEMATPGKPECMPLNHGDRQAI